MAKMNKDLFVTVVQEMLEGKGLKTFVKEVTKREFSYLGIGKIPEAAGNKQNHVSAAVNIDDMYENYVSGKATIYDTVEFIYDTLTSIDNNIDEHVQFDFKKWEDVKPRLFVAAAKKSYNEEYLKDKVYLEIGDIALVVRIYVYTTNDGEVASAAMPEPILKEYNLSKEDVVEAALKNSTELFPGSCMNLSDVLQKFIPAGTMPAGEIDLWCVANGQNGGAAALFYPGMMNEIKEKLGGNFYILPSSMHEVLVISINALQEKNMNAQDMIDLVRGVNKAEVSAEEQLSDNPLVYISGKLIDTVTGRIIFVEK